MKLKFLAAACMLYTGMFAQLSFELPMASPASSVTHRVGITDITISYHSPAVAGRKIWGKLVPYGQVWRAGANQNTTISFTHDVSVGSTQISAGTYGLHMIPTEKEWTVIFSKNATSWGSYFYKAEEDVVRVNVKPEVCAHSEFLTYTPVARKANSITLALQWEKVSIPFTIESDVNKIVFAKIKDDLRSVPGFTWTGYYEAADFCLQNNYNLEQGFKWIEVAEGMSPKEFIIKSLKARYLEAKGDSAGAEKLILSSLDLAGESGINRYGYDLVLAGKLEKAANVFRINIKKYPESWNVYDSYAEVLQMQGNTKESLKYYEMALKKAPQDQKARIETLISGLKAKG